MSSPTLTPVGEKFLPSPYLPSTLRYCPTADLLAAVTHINHAIEPGSKRTDEKLGVWRLNGETVLEWDVPAGSGVVSVAWKRDGKMVAVGMGDGGVRLISVAGGKVVSVLAPPSLVLVDGEGGGEGERGGKKGVGKLGWVGWVASDGRGQVEEAEAGMMREEDGENEEEDGFVFGDGEGEEGQLKTDLPKLLAQGVDVEMSIPKLSILPPGTGVASGWKVGGSAGDDDIFSSRASIDAIFHSHGRGRSSTSTSLAHDDSLDILVTGYEDGTVFLRIFDCFEIGQIDITASLPKGTKSAKVIQHSAHPASPTHALIVQSLTARNEEQTHLLALDLNFIPQTSPRYLSTLATKSTQLLNLLRYLKQVSLIISIELRAAFDLPSRFMRNADEALSSGPPDESMDLVAAVYSLAVTGTCPDEFRDWLVDDMGERNLKRWEKASVHGLETIRRLLHECLLPALEHAQVVGSRLNGLALSPDSSSILGLVPIDIAQIADTLSCLTLLAHTLLQTTSRTLAGCATFLKFLRLETEILSLERENAGGPGSERLEELCLQRDETDVRAVLGFLTSALRQNPLLNLTRPAEDARGEKLEGEAFVWGTEKSETPYYPTFVTALRAKGQDEKGQEEKGTKRKRPDLHDLLFRLHGQCEVVFRGIAQTLRRSVLCRRVATLETGIDSSLVRSRVVHHKTKDKTLGPVVIVAARKRSKPGVISVFQASLVEIMGSLAQAQLKGRKFHIPGWEDDVEGPPTTFILDVDFIDDSDLMLLSGKQDRLSDPSKDASGQKGDQLHVLREYQGEGRWETWHEFEAGPTGATSEISVTGREGRKAVAAVQAEAGRILVLDLEQNSNDTEDDEGEEDGEEGDVEMGE